MPGSGGTIANLAVRVGADTSDFTRGMGQVDREVGATAAGLGRIGNRLRGDVAQPLLLAGLAATRFGGQITTSFMDSAGVTSKLAVETNGLFLATGRLADSSLMAIAAFGKLSAVRLSAKNLNIGMLALATDAAQAGWAVGRLIAEVTGLDDALREHAGKPTKQIAEALASSEQRYQATRAQVEALTRALHLSGPQWETSSTRTAENAVRLAEVNAALLEHVARRRSLMKTMTEYFTHLEQEDSLHKRNIATLEVARLKWLETEGVMTKAMAAAAMGEMNKDLGTMAENGVAGAEILRGVGGRITELVERARAMGVDVPPLLGNMYDAIKEKNLLWIEDTARAMEKVGTAMPKAIADSAEANKAELKRLEDLYAGTISGGFGRGAEEGVGFAKQQVDAWRRELEATPIKLKFDASAIQALFEAISKGRIPVTSGSAP